MLQCINGNKNKKYVQYVHHFYSIQNYIIIIIIIAVVVVLHQVYLADAFMQSAAM